MMSIDQQYINLVRDIATNGDDRPDRTGTGTKALFGRTIEYDMTYGGVPLLSVKRVYWKTAARELLWMLSGSTNIRPLVQQGVSIWTDWPLQHYRQKTGSTISRVDFEDSISTDADFAEQWGNLGPVYGYQWRNWSSVDQIAGVIDSLRNDPFGRRHIVEGWNVSQLDQMALPPCHKTYQFFVDGRGAVGAILYQRSCDVALGLPFNLFNLGLLTAMIAQQVGRQPGMLTWFGADVHLYSNHMEYADQITATGLNIEPIIRLNKRDSIDDYTIDDIMIDNYQPKPAIKAEVAV